ncbi:MAG TPA: IS3 family transposase [Pseudonocardiaceae bacterium]|nr:IS3 family transposase [Pseudonocardiaceae bacterium]
MYRYIHAEKARDASANIAVMCRVLGVSRSGYYGWVGRQLSPPTGRAAADQQLLEQIRHVHARFSYYGSPRIHQHLLIAAGHAYQTSHSAVAAGHRPRLGRRRVARLMRDHGIRARIGKIKSRPRSAPPKRRPEIGDQVQRQFQAVDPNELWFTDITQIRTGQGWLYAAVILDAFNREVISWATAAQDNLDTAVDALAEAIRIRRPDPGTIIHSDRGYQFTSAAWLDLARSKGLVVSIGERKDCFDNAVMESWLGSFKTEVLYPNGQPATRTQARTQLFQYIWDYNTHRLHSTLGYVSPKYYAQHASTCP